MNVTLKGMLEAGVWLILQIRWLMMIPVILFLPILALMLWFDEWPLIKRLNKWLAQISLVRNKNLR